MINYTKLRKKINPPPDGQDTLVLRVGTVTAIAADGTVTLTLSSGAVKVGVPVLGGAFFVVNSVVQVLSYRGSMLIIGGSTGVSAQPAVQGGNTGNGTTTSTGFTNSLTDVDGGGGIHGVVFIAPPSGTVFVMGRSVGYNTGAGGFSILEFQINAGNSIGSGTSFRAASEAKASVYQSDSANQQGEHSISDLVGGLTPGAVYNASLAYHRSGGTAAGYNRRHITVLPQ